MALAEKSLCRQAVNNSGEVIYTVPVGPVIVVKDINICNTGSTDCYITVWLVPNGDSPTDENILLSQMNVPANDIRHWSGFQVLEDEGDTIQALAETTDQITLLISGGEIT